MPLDPQAQKLLDALKELPPVETLTVLEARKRFVDAFRTRGEPEQVRDLRDLLVPGPEGDIPVRCYVSSEGGPHPVLLYFHGGGGVVGGLETHDALCRRLSNGAACMVLSVDYRLAPEHKYPAALNDCYHATQWAFDHVADLNGDPARIAVGGDSAGGSLAAGVTLLSRDRGGPTLVYQLLFYPMMDYCDPGRASYHEHGAGTFLTTEAIQWFLSHYLPEDFDRFDPYLFPLQSEDLSGLPPAGIMTAEYDPLRDEGESYGRRLRDSGVPVRLKRIDGMMHGFTIMAKRLDKARMALEEAALHLKQAFHRCPTL